MDELEKAKSWLASLDIHSEYEATMKELILSELEELQKENTVLKKQLNSAFDNGFVSKDKIREKIEYLKQLDFGADLVMQSIANLTTVCILKELLEEQK